MPFNVNAEKTWRKAERRRLVQMSGQLRTSPRSGDDGDKDKSRSSGSILPKPNKLFFNTTNRELPTTAAHLTHRWEYYRVL